jgi:hypothetical protein
VPPDEIAFVEWRINDLNPLAQAWMRQQIRAEPRRPIRAQPDGEDEAGAQGALDAPERSAARSE